MGEGRNSSNAPASPLPPQLISRPPRMGRASRYAAVRVAQFAGSASAMRNGVTLSRLPPPAHSNAGNEPAAHHVPSIGRLGARAWRPRAALALDQVPMLRGARSLRSMAMTLCAVIRPVLGFSDGMFWISMDSSAESDTTCT